jgi:hypothetical protein
MRPENGVTGTSIRQAGGWWDGRRDTVGYTVQHAAHWIYEGTGLKDGDVFGADPAFPLIGYEADGATFTRKRGLAVVTGDQGTPLSFFILGIAELGEGWVRASPHAAARWASTRATAAASSSTGRPPTGRAWSDGTSRSTGSRGTCSIACVSGRCPSSGPLPIRHGRMLAVAGEPALFHVDTAALPPGSDRRYAWRVTTGAANQELSGQPGAGGLTCRVLMPPEPTPATVTVTVADAGTPVGFGTLTFVPLSVEEDLKTDAVALLREMVMPGEPSNPLVHPTAEPVSRTWMLYSTGSVRLPWLEDRAARLAEVVRRLRALGRERPRPVDAMSDSPCTRRGRRAPASDRRRR